MKRIALFGGSFDPVHIGHITIADYVANIDTIDEVWMMLSPQNPLKDPAQHHTTDLQRLEILQKAITGHPHLKICDIELRLPRPNYTCNTLQALKTEHPDAEFSLIIGEDNLALFTRWRNWKQILTLHHLYVYPRTGSQPTLQHPHIHRIDAPQINISSTEIRNRIAQQLSIQGMVPDTILPLVQSFYK